MASIALSINGDRLTDDEARLSVLSGESNPLPPGAVLRHFIVDVFVTRESLLRWIRRELSLRTFAGDLGYERMSDAVDYFRSYAVAAIIKARAMPRGLRRNKQRAVARIYHLLATEASYASNVSFMDDS